MTIGTANSAKRPSGWTNKTGEAAFAAGSATRIVAVADLGSAYAPCSPSNFGELGRIRGNFGPCAALEASRSMAAMLQIDDHPLLAASVFRTTFASPLGEVQAPADWPARMGLAAEAPVARSEELRKAVRDLLRHGGYKPTGRGKPACEYLLRAAGEELLGSINPAVDACNIASLHSGLPISVVDLACATEPLRIGIADTDATYVFNASGQEIRIGGLLCLFDADGPCANAVKDAQRTKTSDETTSTLSVVWGVRGFESQVERTATWYRELLAACGASTAEALTK